MSNAQSEQAETALIEACGRNDRQAQEQLYRLFFADMFKMCMHYCHHDRETALTVLNDGMMRVFQKIDCYEHRGTLGAWVRTLVFHAVVQHFRNQKQYQSRIVLSEFLPENGSAYNESPEQLYVADLLQLTEKLPPATRQVFQLFAVEGFHHDEIAAQLGISVGTSKWHLSEARRRLQQLLNHQTQIT